MVGKTYIEKKITYFSSFSMQLLSKQKNKIPSSIYIVFFCFRRRNIIKKIHNFSHTNRIIFIISKVFFLHTAFDIISCWHFSVGFVYIFIWKKSSRKKFVSFVANLVEVFFKSIIKHNRYFHIFFLLNLAGIMSHDKESKLIINLDFFVEKYCGKGQAGLLFFIPGDKPFQLARRFYSS